MQLLLNAIYLLLLIALSPALLYSAWRKGKYREGYGEKFLGRVPIRQGSRQCFWLHAVSAGEVNLLIPLIAELRTTTPECDIFVSTTTKTGHSLAQSKLEHCTVFYCPLDFSWAVNSAIRRIRPDVLVLAELELWPNLIFGCKRAGASVVVVNGRLSQSSYRGYRYLRPLVASMLKSLDLIAVQDDEYAGRFVDLGAPSDVVTVTGSMKFDGARTDRSNFDTLRLALLAGITSEDTVFLAGSTQAPEEEYALNTFLRLREDYPGLRLVLVPRHPERFEQVADMLQRSGVAWQRRSRLDGTRDSRARILLVDTMGELGAWWGTAQIAFVGGSMGRRGGQNMIEPAAYGAAISFGPNTRNFRDVVERLLACDAGAVVKGETEMFTFVQRCLSDPAYSKQLGRHARELVQANLGATSRTMDLIQQVIGTETDGWRRAS